MPFATLELSAFLSGTIVPIEDVPDPVFSRRVMGDGIAIAPAPAAEEDECTVCAPCAGRVVQLHGMRHACVIEADSGARLLLHAGLNTVQLKGEGFASHVEPGETVAAGQPLISFDSQVLARHGKSPMTVLAVENNDEHLIVWRNESIETALGQPLLHLLAAATATQGDEDPLELGETAQGWAVVRHPGGLHARVCALVADAVRPFGASVEVEARGRRASARSVTGLLGLAVSVGEEVLLVANGARAGDALEAAIAAIEKPSDGVPPNAALSAMLPMTPAPSPAPAPTPAPQLARGAAPTAAEALPAPALAAQLHGVVASAGLAVGVTARLVHRLGEVQEFGEGVMLERLALGAALKAVAAEVESISVDARLRGLGEQADIFAAHRVLAEDPALAAAADAQIAAGKSAAFAWRRAIDAQCVTLEATGSELLRARVADLRDIERQVLRRLVGEGDALAMLPSGVVLLADDLLPSDLSSLAATKVAAIVTARGGPTSHLAILASAHGIPVVVAVGPQLADLGEGQMVVVDAEQGVIELQPSLERVEAVRQAVAERDLAQAEALARASFEARTLDGVRIEVAANGATAADAGQALGVGAEGVGLLRTELLFTDRDDAPTEHEQRMAYQAVVDAMRGRSVIFRTLDVGADKHLAYAPQSGEENPALGLRGIRLSLSREALLTTQLAAILALRPLAKVCVMLPMVTDVGELRRVRELVARLSRERGVIEPLTLGVMIETPASALQADQLAREADFFSLGTNDLTQYTLCMDRGNPELAARLDGLHPSVLRLIGMSAESAARHRRWVGACGAMASEPAAIPLLIGLGVTELSVSPAAIPGVKAQVRRLAAAVCRDVARRALLLDSAAAVRELVTSTWPWLAPRTA